LAIFLCSAQPSLADYAAGSSAYEAKDYRTAYKEWTEAASAGDPSAQLKLGNLYEEGVGVALNFVEAYRWYILTSAANEPGAKVARDAVAEKMSKDELAHPLADRRDTSCP
jgi:TPR repeat protein